MKAIFLELRGRFRIFFGFCPACNSDAPKKQNCKVCNDFYGVPDKGLKKTWWNNFIMTL